MKKLIIWLALLLPFFANAQVNGTIQKNVSTGTIRGSFGSLGLDTLTRVTGALVNGYILKYHAATNKWYASPDGYIAGLQDSLTKKANRTFDNVASWIANYKIAYVDTLGNDSTAIIGRQDKPYATISAAIAALPSSGGKIKIGIGSFASPSSTISLSNVIIEGSGVPATNGLDSIKTEDNELVTLSSPTRLVGGTILKGGIRFQGVQNVQLLNLGVDRGFDYVNGGGTEGDVIFIANSNTGDTTSTPPFQLMKGIVLKNISSLGLSPNSLTHAVLIENAYEPLLDNIRTYYGVHGIAIKSVGGIITNIFNQGHGFNGIIIKSDNYAYSSQLTLSNFRISSIGSNDGGGINIQTQGGVHNYIKISNGIIYRTKFGIQSVNDMPTNVDIDNVSVIKTIGYGFWVTSGGQYIKISNSLALGNLYDGFNINANAPYSLLSNNSAIDNGGDGFDLSSGYRADFDNLLAINNSGYGIRASLNVYGGTRSLIGNTLGASTGTILDRITSFTNLTLNGTTNVVGPALGTGLSWTDNLNNTGYLGIRSGAASIGADNKLQFETAGTERGSFSSTGAFKVNGLSGSGNRLPYLNSNGDFIDAVIGPGLSLSNDTLSATGGSFGSVSGTGTSGFIPKWTGSASQANSIIQDDGSVINVGSSSTSAGIGSANLFSTQIMSTGSVSGYFWENRSGGVTSNSNWYGWYTTGAGSAARTHLYNGSGNILTIDGTNGDIISPALTGNPTAPTQTAGDNSTKIATTAYVDALGGTILGAQKQIATAYTNSSTSGVSTTSLFNHNIAQSNLSGDGDRIDFSFAGIFDPTGDDKFVTISVGGNTIAISGNASNRSQWEFSGYLMRTTSTTFRIFIKGSVDNVPFSTILDRTVTDFNPLNFQVLGQTNDGADPVTLQIGYLQSKKAP